MITIRQAEKCDLESIIQIEQACFPAAEAASSDTLLERFNVFRENFIVATKQDEIVGFINGCTTNQPNLPDILYHDTSLHNPHGDYQTVFGLAVDPAFHHQGIATKLMQHFITLTKTREKKGIILTCKNHLITYYEQFGYKNQGISASVHGGSQWNDMLLIF